MSGDLILPSVSQMLRNVFHGGHYQEERLARLKAHFSSIPEGKELLDLAEKLNIPLKIEKNPGSLGATKVTRTYISDAEGNLQVAEVRHDLTLDPRLSDKGMIEIMAHELRHVWQGEVLGYGHDLPYFSDVRNAIVFTRLIEGDAHAFQKYFMDRLAGLEPSSESIRQTFFKFQNASLRGMSYDLNTISQHDEIRAAMKSNGDLKRMFNAKSKTSLSEAGDFQHIFVAGLHVGAPIYLDIGDEANLKTMILNHIGKIASKALSARVIT